MMFEGLGGFGAHLLDQNELRRRLATFYESHQGLRSSGKTEAEYEALMFPNDRPDWRRRAADEMFSCALRFLAGCRLLGVPHPLLAEPYERRVGRAIADAEAVVRAFGALVEGPALAFYEPAAGDAMMIGAGNDVHISCIVLAGYDTSAAGDAFRRVVCVDGGQGRKNDMAIERNAYALDPGPGAGVSARSIEAPLYSYERPGPARPVRWYADVWTLVLNAGLMK